MKYLNDISEQWKDATIPPGYVYLASPYTAKNTITQLLRYEMAKEACVQMMVFSIPVYSPIVHCHPIAADYGLGKEAAHWWKMNQEFIRSAGELWVLMLDGWEESSGIRQEVEYALEIECQVRYCYFDEHNNLLLVEYKELK